MTLSTPESRESSGMVVVCVCIGKTGKGDGTMTISYSLKGSLVISYKCNDTDTFTRSAEPVHNIMWQCGKKGNVLKKSTIIKKGKYLIVYHFNWQNHMIR